LPLQQNFLNKIEKVIRKAKELRATEAEFLAPQEHVGSYTAMACLEGAGEGTRWSISVNRESVSLGVDSNTLENRSQHRAVPKRIRTHDWRFRSCRNQAIMRGGGQMSRHQDVDTAPCQDRQGAAFKLLLVKCKAKPEINTVLRNCRSIRCYGDQHQQ